VKRAWFVAAALLTLAADGAQAQLRGHGGPVRALALTTDGRTLLSGGFDEAAILWSLAEDRAEQVLRFHGGSVNAVAFLADGRIATAGNDQTIALWRRGEMQPAARLVGHDAPIAGLAVSRDGALLASASWDRTLRLWSLRDILPARVLEGHQQNVNAVAFTGDGRHVVSVAYDLTLRLWPLDGGTPIVETLPTPLNALAIAPDGEIIVAGADGAVHVRAPDGSARAVIAGDDAPIVGLAISPDGATIAATNVKGSVLIIDRAARRVLRTFTGQGLPAWSVVFLPDNRTLVTGGTDHLIRRWNVRDGAEIASVGAARTGDPLAAYAGDPGAEIFRACIACHTLRAEDGPRAGPTLSGIIGRRIASLPGYNFSEALTRLDIIWTPETIAKLFELGPATYTPGTKMPEQTLGSPEDRAALVRFLERATR
jgi:cytochrome c